MELVETLVKSFGPMDGMMSHKVHILDAHFEKFKDNMGVYLEEQFHQNILDLNTATKANIN